jgi:hypothetical protein
VIFALKKTDCGPLSVVIVTRTLANTLVGLLSKFRDFVFILVSVVLTIKVLATFMMSGSVHPLSVKYSILRSISESATFSHSASATILEIKNSLASRSLWNAFGR